MAKAKHIKHIPNNHFSGFISLWRKIVHAYKQSQFNSKKQKELLEDLYVLIDDGVPANRAFELLKQITTGITQEVVMSILEHISQGHLIADGMTGWFDHHICEITRAGEQGGSFKEALKAGADSLQHRDTGIHSFLSSITYPFTMFITGLVVTVYINNTVLKQFRSIKPLSQWPSAGKTVVHLANLLQDWWWIILAFIIIFAIAGTLLIREYTGIYRNLLDKLPLFSLYRRFTSARFMATLGLLIHNGIVFKAALKIMQFQANPYLGWHLLMAEQRLSEGQDNIAKVLDTGLVEHNDILRLQVTAQAKGFDHALMRFGQYASLKNVKTLQRLGKVTASVLLFAGFGLAALLVFGIYTVGATLA